MLISKLTSKRNSSETFFTGDRKSPWYLVAFGMVGAALSGVTFVSLPGMVGNNNLFFLQFILGNVVGYIFITFILIPLYYKLKLVSIYGFLDHRFGKSTYKTGAGFFLVSQSFGAALRLLLAGKILHFAFFEKLNIPFFLTITIILILVWMYSNKSGIKTIVWTDTLQTLCLLLGAIITIYLIIDSMNLNFADSIKQVTNHEFFTILDFDGKSPNNFFKQFIAGFLITIGMIGLDQNMMQKTLTCKSKWEAQKNSIVYSLILALTQFLFLGLGVLLYIYAKNNGIAMEIGSKGAFLNTDNLFPNIALNYLGPVAGVCFLLGIIASSFSSVDSALTALTTSFTYDILEISDKNPKQKNLIKNIVLVGFSTVIFLIIMVFSYSKGDVISLIFKIAAYTYGPLLSLYLIGMFSKLKVKDSLVPVVCILAPLFTYYLNYTLINRFGFDFGFVNIAVNAVITSIGFIIIRDSKRKVFRFVRNTQ